MKTGRELAQHAFAGTALLLLSTSANAQDRPAPEPPEVQAVPPPPEDPRPAPPSPPLEEPASSTPARALDPPRSVELASPVGPPVAGTPDSELVAAQPLVDAAQVDLFSGRPHRALARVTVAIEVLPPGTPLRIRAEGLGLIARRRLSSSEPPPTADEIFAPLVEGAELDRRAGQPHLAAPRLDLALARLPAGSPLWRRAVSLRRTVAQALGQSSWRPPSSPTIAPGAAAAEESAPRDRHRRGTGEIVELYITGALFGALTGSFIPTVAADTVSATTYTLTSLNGAGLLAVGVYLLDLSADLRTGVAPTVSSSIRIGFANGMLAWALAAEATTPNASEAISLVWGGAALGAATGLAVGFGLEPTVRDARFVESAALWGGVLGSSAALIMDGVAPLGQFALMMAAMDGGLIAGILAAAMDAHPSTNRTLFLDLGFLVGTGVGALLPCLYYMSQQRAIQARAVGTGIAIGSVAGWLLTFVLTDRLDGGRSADPDPADVRVGLAPLEHGAALSIGGVW